MNDTPETRHLCTECWTEGEGSAPKACPVCGTVGAWFVTATHGNRPLKEVLVGLFSGYQVPPELEGVLTKPSEYAQAEDEKQAAELREAVGELLGDKRPRITRTPGLMGGNPCVDGTRVTVATVLDEVFAGTFDDEIHRRYPTLPEGSVDACMRWAVEALSDELQTRQSLAWLDSQADVQEDK